MDDALTDELPLGLVPMGEMRMYTHGGGEGGGGLAGDDWVDEWEPWMPGLGGPRGSRGGMGGRAEIDDWGPARPAEPEEQDPLTKAVREAEERAGARDTTLRVSSSARNAMVGAVPKPWESDEAMQAWMDAQGEGADPPEQSDDPEPGPWSGIPGGGGGRRWRPHLPGDEEPGPWEDPTGEPPDLTEGWPPEWDSPSGNDPHTWDVPTSVAPNVGPAYQGPDPSGPVTLPGPPGRDTCIAKRQTMDWTYETIVGPDPAAQRSFMVLDPATVECTAWMFDAYPLEWN